MLTRQILLIEKSGIQSSELRNTLIGSGHHLISKENGIEALLWLERGNIPDLIFADTEMGFMSGKKFVKYLKSSGFFSEIPVVAFANLSRQDDLAAMMRAGAQYYLYKPFEKRELEEKIHRIFLHQLVA